MSTILTKPQRFLGTALARWWRRVLRNWSEMLGGWQAFPRRHSELASYSATLCRHPGQQV